MTYLELLRNFYNWQKTNHVPGNARLLYYEILGLFNEAGWPESIQLDNYRLMWMVDTRTERVAIAARDKLVELGFIEYKRGRKGSPNEYWIKKYTPQKVSENDSVSDSVSVSENDSVSVSVSVPETVSHIKTKTKTKTKKVPPKSPQGESTPVCGKDRTGFGEELQAAFEGWLAYKRERRERYTPMALKSLVTQITSAAAAHGDKAVIGIIQQSMANGYRGIMFDRLARHGKPPVAGTAASSYDINELESMSGFLLPDNL